MKKIIIIGLILLVAGCTPRYDVVYEVPDEYKQDAREFFEELLDRGKSSHIAENRIETIYGRPIGVVDTKTGEFKPISEFCTFDKE